MGVKNDLIDITDEKTNGIIYETFDIPASLFFEKTPVHSVEHKGSYRIFADLIFADAVLYRENRKSLVLRKFPSVRYIKYTRTQCQRQPSLHEHDLALILCKLISCVHVCCYKSTTTVQP